MKKWMITIGLLILFVLSLASCSTEPNEDELKKRFENYTPDGNVVVVLDSSTFYFADHTLSLRDIADGESPNNGYLFMDGKLYFSTSKENGPFDFSLYVYICDLYGNDKQLVFEKHGYKTHPWATGNQGRLYIEHFTTNAVDASSRVIDSYNVVTGVYQTEATGETVGLSDYQKSAAGAYSYVFEGGVLSVTDAQQNKTYTMHTSAFVSQAFGEALEGLDCSFSGFYASANGRMFVLYRIESGGSAYPHLVCEYLPDNNEVVFGSLCFAEDVAAFYIEYLQ